MELMDMLVMTMSSVKIPSGHSFAVVLSATSKMIMTKLVLTMMSVKEILTAVIFNHRKGVANKLLTSCLQVLKILKNVPSPKSVLTMMAVIAVNASLDIK